MDPTPMELLLQGVGSVSTFMFGVVTQTVGFIVDKPLMLMFFSIAVVGAGVGLFQRLRG